MQLDVRSYDVHRYIGAAWLPSLSSGLSAPSPRSVRFESQPARNRIVYVTLVCLAVSCSDLRFGPLAWRFVPMSAAAAYTGLALTIAGIAFTIWARFYLGSNWSGRPTIKEDHTLVRSGPYALVRHPIYTGILLGLLGTAIAHGKTSATRRDRVVLIGLKGEIARGRKLMTEQFGADYLNYKQQVKGLIPFVW